MFNDRLRSTRLHRKYTQQQMAESLHIATRNYQKYEQGVTTPPYETLITLADILDVPIDYLLGRDKFLKSLGVFVDVPQINPPRRPNGQLHQ